jgi:CheY-like chemotaxis protein
VSAEALAGSVRPDVILMDINIPGVNGIEATRRICVAKLDIRILMVTMLEAEPAEVLRAIRPVANGEAIFTPGIAERLIHYCATPPAATNNGARSMGDPIFPDLTECEREVLGLIALELTNSAIADRLVLSPKTVAITSPPQVVYPVENLGKLCLVNVIDTTSRLKVESSPCMDTTNPPLEIYQLVLLLRDLGALHRPRTVHLVTDALQQCREAPHGVPAHRGRDCPTPPCKSARGSSAGHHVDRYLSASAAPNLTRPSTYPFAVEYWYEHNQ